MRKIILLITAVLMTITSAYAQFALGKSGYAVFGKRKMQGSPQLSGTVMPNNPPVEIDTLATAVFLGKGTNNSGGYVTFGEKKNVWIGERAGSPFMDSYVMELGFTNGILGKSRRGNIFHYSCAIAANVTPFIFYTDVRANSFIVDSDTRLKGNVKGLGDLSDMLRELSPVSYTLVSQSVPEEGVSEKMSMENEMCSDVAVAPDSRVRYGFLAQEVKEIFPELVIEDENGTLGIDYIGFIPLLVDRIKRLEARLESQELGMAALASGEKEALRPGVASVKASLIEAGCVLEQNRPNPFSATTTIMCNIPSGVKDASVFVYDLQGQQILHLTVEDRGSASVEIEASSLRPGMYIYSLIADGVEVDTKKMIVTD